MNKFLAKYKEMVFNVLHFVLDTIVMIASDVTNEIIFVLLSSYGAFVVKLLRRRSRLALRFL